jgi:hypothetical protein
MQKLSVQERAAVHHNSKSKQARDKNQIKMKRE